MRRQGRDVGEVVRRVYRFCGLLCRAVGSAISVGNTAYFIQSDTMITPVAKVH